MKVSVTGSPAVSTSNAPVTSSSISFSSVLEQVRALDLQPEVNRIKSVLNKHNGRDLRITDLLNYQIRVGEWNLRVELASRAADGVITTLRKLQSGQ